MELTIDAVVKDLEKANRTVLGQVEVDLGGRSDLASTAKMVFGGKLSPDRLIVIAAAGPHGPEAVIQPLAGHSPLPGEYYVNLPGALRVPAAYAETTFSQNWQTEDDDELQTWLRSNKFDAHLLPNELKHGLAKIDLPWVVQLFPTASDRSVAVFTLGGFSGMGSMRAATAIVDQLAPAVAWSTAETMQAPMHGLRFADLANVVFSGRIDDLRVEEEPPRLAADPSQVAEAIPAALRDFAGKRTIIGPIDDAKKRGNVFSKVAPSVDPTDAVAFIDTGLRAVGKAGLVFTTTDVHISELGSKWTIPYGDVRSVSHSDSAVKINAVGHDEIKLMAGHECEPIVAALDAARLS